MSNPYEIDPHYFNSVNVSDVFKEELDITWAYGLNNLDRTFTKLPIEKIIDGKDEGDITYTYNNEWYRCDDFTSDHGKYHVLFSGCSQTEGVGSPIDTVWSKMVHQYLNEKYNVGGFYTLARSGNGWQKIITNFRIYVKKYGFPTHLFLLMPNVGRKYKWDATGWRYVQKYPYEPSRQDLRDEHVLSIEEHRTLLIDFVVSWKLFEEYCKVNGTKIIWSTWDYQENTNYINADQFDNFFVIDENQMIDYSINARPDGKLGKWDIKRRDGHSGILHHEFWTQRFIEEIENRGLFSD